MLVIDATVQRPSYGVLDQTKRKNLIYSMYQRATAHVTTINFDNVFFSQTNSYERGNILSRLHSS